MTSLSTHVLDAGRGGPRAGVIVEVQDQSGTVVATATSDDDGRAKDLAPALLPGRYHILWRMDRGFLPEVRATVDLLEDRHYHVPLLASDTMAVLYLGA